MPPHWRAARISSVLNNLDPLLSSDKTGALERNVPWNWFGLRRGTREAMFVIIGNCSGDWSDRQRLQDGAREFDGAAAAGGIGDHWQSRGGCRNSIGASDASAGIRRSKATEKRRSVGREQWKNFADCSIPGQGYERCGREKC